MFDTNSKGSRDDLLAWTQEDDRLVAELIAAAEGSLAGSTQVQEHDAVQRIRAHARNIAAHQAMLIESMMEVVDEYTELADGDLEAAMEGAVSEVRAALSLTRRAAESDLDLAWSLRERLPHVLKHWRMAASTSVGLGSSRRAPRT